MPEITSIPTEKIPAFYFDAQELLQVADKYRDEFASAKPFPHVVIDNFMPPEILDIAVDEFPAINQIKWKLWGPGETENTGDKNIEKVGVANDAKFGPFTRHFMGQLISSTFLRFLKSLTRATDLLVDPSFNGCGLHSTGRGGKLMIHTDTNRHPIKSGDMIHQRYNLILFLNKDWREEYGGHLELWNRDATQCEKRILPIYNRCVIFDTGTYSYHGHPQPLTCPEGRRRNSLAVYYYALNRTPNPHYKGMQRHVAWVETTPEEKKWKAAQTQMPRKIMKLLKRLTPKR
ncbi:MAG: 2OG-Fe(II) oxygenase [Candidatus Omnitrophota bacterium]|nr:2OG-Fe(II) oxygenase [Candidatus Omnitrophota bacterium]